MPGVYTAHIHTFEVREKKAKGVNRGVHPWRAPHFPAGSQPLIPEVVMESGAEDEVDSIKIVPRLIPV